jgi:hypothetical protein
MIAACHWLIIIGLHRACHVTSPSPERASIHEWLCIRIKSIGDAFDPSHNKQGRLGGSYIVVQILCMNSLESNVSKE